MTTAAHERRVVVLNRAGLHARPSLAIAQLARQFDARVQVRSPYQTVDAGDVLQLLSLGAHSGAELRLTATGRQAVEALDALADLFARRFGLEDEQ